MSSLHSGRMFDREHIICISSLRHLQIAIEFLFSRLCADVVAAVSVIVCTRAGFLLGGTDQRSNPALAKGLVVSIHPQLNVRSRLYRERIFRGRILRVREGEHGTFKPVNDFAYQQVSSPTC